MSEPDVDHPDVRDAFDAFVRLQDPAMVVLTVGDGVARWGCLAGFHAQVSIDPRRYLVAISQANATFRRAVRAPYLGVNLLGADARGLASLFGETTADDGVDKFAHCAWTPTPEGPPVLDDAVAWMVGEVVDRVDLGDHTGHLLAPVRAALGTADATPLRLGDVADLDAGH